MNKKCHNCGVINWADKTVCVRCQSPLLAAPPPPQQYTATAAAPRSESASLNGPLKILVIAVSAIAGYYGSQWLLFAGTGESKESLENVRQLEKRDEDKRNQPGQPINVPISKEKPIDKYIRR